MTLNQAQLNIPVRILSITRSSISVRLMEMGLHPEKSVKVLYKAPLGDPMAIDLGEYVLSLRKDEAALIEVDYTEGVEQ